MINVSEWTGIFMKMLCETFGDRVWFAGLQGSYARGEATENSDIDLVVILDELSPADIRTYSDMLDSLSRRELICGFLCGKNELMNWDTADLFQLCYDTNPLFGSLDLVLSLIDKGAVDRAIKMGVCSIYHGCVHNMLYGKSEESLIGLYKSASFVIQATAFRRSGRYTRCLKDLLCEAVPDERSIIENFLHLKNGGEVDFDTMSEALFEWTKRLIDEVRE